MFSPENFQEFAQDIADANGIALELAEEYAALIGDTPELDEQGRAIVRRESDGVEIARLVLPADDDDGDDEEGGEA